MNVIKQNTENIPTANFKTKTLKKKKQWHSN